MDKGIATPGKSASLPEYILERNSAALAAGLSIERQNSSKELLTTWYRGSEAQWRASTFCLRSKPFNKSAMGWGDFECFSPDTNAGLYVQFRLEGDYRGSVPRERLPIATYALDGGVVGYKMDNHRGDNEYRVYIGDPKALIDCKVAPPEILAMAKMQIPTFDGGYSHKATVWRREILRDGRYCFLDYVGERERIKSGVDSVPRSKSRVDIYSDPAKLQALASQVRIIEADEIEKRLSALEQSAGKRAPVCFERPANA